MWCAFELRDATRDKVCSTTVFSFHRRPSNAWLFNLSILIGPIVFPSIGIGGGSLVRQDPNTGRVTVGPDSVGFRITEEALVFGGDELTATDIVVAADIAPGVGDATKVTHLTSEEGELIEKARERIRVMLENTLDAMKTSLADIPVYLVGGGSILVPEGTKLKGVSKVCRFESFEVAKYVPPLFSLLP